ncbi:MAG: hypothetical protein ACI35P_07265 [Bacillus sp. (in: firmicutes)]
MISHPVSPNHPFSQGFNCPVCKGSSSSHHHFCLPYDCPQKIPTTLFSSPNSSFSKEELEQLKECIEEANNLLLALGSPRDPENTRMLQLHFLALRKNLVEVKIQCDEKVLELLGIVETAGRNFLQITMVGKTTFILFERICSVNRNVTHESDEHMQALINVGGCTRRELVLNFGNFVARNPKLANLFFGIALHLQLRAFIGCQVLVKKEGEDELICGILVCSREGHIQIKKKDDLEQINFADICFISIKQ